MGEGGRSTIEGVDGGLGKLVDEDGALAAE